VPDLWHQGIQNRQVGCQQIPERKEEGLDISCVGISSPFLLLVTLNKFMCDSGIRQTLDLCAAAFA